MQTLEQAIDTFSLRKKKNGITFLTGAGISADSGIPTYRGTDGIWVKGTKFYKPQEFGTLKYFKKSPEEVWQFCLFRKKMIEEALPNESHRLLAKVEELVGEKFHLITQNIDNLHRRAGSKNLYEIHGHYREIKCSEGCKTIIPFPIEVKSKELTEDMSPEEISALKCPDCGAWMRPNVLWFDEYYDEKTHKIESSLRIAKNTGILFVIGTSGATNLPMQIARTCLNYGGVIVDVNLEDNQFTYLIEDLNNKVIIRKTSTEALTYIYKTLNTL